MDRCTGQSTEFLTSALEGPPADVLKDIDQSAPLPTRTSGSSYIEGLAYGSPRDAMRRFDNRRQQDNESLQAYEQALCLLHRGAWPEKTAVHRDSELKRRFEDGLLNAEISQYLRLHARECVISPQRYSKLVNMLMLLRRSTQRRPCVSLSSLLPLPR